MEYEDEDFYYLYKYLPFNEGTLCVISEGTIKFTNPLDFNDPFDCRVSYADNYVDTSDEFRARCGNWVEKGWMKTIPSPANRIEAKRKIENKHNSERYVQEFFGQVGLVSLSENPLSVLMWSHYAQNHKGFVVEFKLQKKGNFSQALEEFIPFPVSYNQSFPIINKSDRNNPEIVHKFFLNKSDDWRYEKEHRIIVQGRKAGIYPYPRSEVLSSVIAGWKMSKDDWRKLVKAVKKAGRDMGTELKVFTVENIKDKYALTVPNHPRLDICKKR